MIASPGSNAPLAVIIGATGQQGGSVVNALIQSAKPYRIVGLTRDSSKASALALAEQGVKLHQVDISPGKESDVIKAFEGADIVFAVTSSADLRSKENEIAQGKLMIDAAKVSRVKLFIWSPLESSAKWSKGRLSAVWVFDAKAEITDYLRESGVTFVLVPAGGYLSSLWTGGAVGLVKQSDGSRVLTLPCPATTELYVVDTPRDYGTYVRAAIENPNVKPGSEVLTGTKISYEDQMAQLSQFTGKKHTFREASREEWDSHVKATGTPPAFGDVLYEAWQFTSEFGYYGDKNVAASQKAAGVTPPTFMEMLKNQKPGTFD